MVLVVQCSKREHITPIGGGGAPFLLPALSSQLS
jgi:hypothetical protein